MTTFKILAILAVIAVTFLMIWVATSKGDTAGYIFAGIIISGCISFGIEYYYTKPKTFTPEYELEIINQDSVRIRSLSTGRVYTERYDQVQNALIKDNL